MAEETKVEEEKAPLDPAAPVHTDDTLPVVTDSSLGDKKPEEEEETQPNQGGDPDEIIPPEKVEETPTPAPADENQQVAEMVAEAGLVPKDLRAAMEANGGTLPIAAMKALVEKHGEGVANLAATKLSEMYKAGQSAIEAANTALYSDFEKQFEGAEAGSGKQHFENAKAWAQKEMSKEDRAGLTELLQSSNPMVRAIGTEKLAQAYQNADSYTQAADLVTGDKLETNQVQGLSKQAYQEEVNKLMSRGYSYDSIEVKSLRNRREAAMKRGR